MFLRKSSVFKLIPSFMQLAPLLDSLHFWGSLQRKIPSSPFLMTLDVFEPIICKLASFILLISCRIFLVVGLIRIYSIFYFSQGRAVIDLHCFLKIFCIGPSFFLIIPLLIGVKLFKEHYLQKIARRTYRKCFL